MRRLALARAALWLAGSLSLAPLPAAAEPAQAPASLRLAATPLGPIGGVHVVDAASGPTGSLRLQLGTDVFAKDDFLHDGETTRAVGGALSVGATPIEHLELSLALTSRSVRGTHAPVERSIGDPSLNVKGYGAVLPGLTFAGDVTLALLTAPDDGRVDYAGISTSLRGSVSLDLRERAVRLPLILRFNASYVFDQSRKVVEERERAQLAALRAEGLTSDTRGDAEYRHLARREERFAWAVNRVDHAALALGVEAPFALSPRVALHPIAEWELWIPVNRQGYDCARLRLPNGEPVAGDERCLEQAGARAFPKRLVLGARLFPVLPGLSVLAALEVGLGPTDRFVKELAPVAPYRVLLAASYALDLPRLR